MAHTPPGETRERVYRFMRRRLLEGRPPTLREARRALGFKAVETVRSHLMALVEEGLLEKDGSKARGYRLPDDPAAGGAPDFVPLLGRVPAGPTDLAVEDVEGYLPTRPRGGVDVDEMFALRIRGDSMRDAGILEGDVVLVRRQPTAENGDIVVALIGDEATVKTFWRGEGRVELRPENPDYEPLRPDPEELVILGKVVEVRRILEGGVA